MTKTGRQSTRHHEMHTEENAMKKKDSHLRLFPAGESRLYWQSQTRESSSHFCVFPSVHPSRLFKVSHSCPHILTIGVYMASLSCDLQFSTQCYLHLQGHPLLFDAILFSGVFRIIPVSIVPVHKSQRS